MKRNEVLMYNSTTRMNLENIMPSGKSQTLKTTYSMISFIGNVPNRQIHKERTQISGCLNQGKWQSDC